MKTGPKPTRAAIGAVSLGSAQDMAPDCTRGEAPTLMLDDYRRGNGSTTMAPRRVLLGLLGQAFKRIDELEQKLSRKDSR